MRKTTVDRYKETCNYMAGQEESSVTAILNKFFKAEVKTRIHLEYGQVHVVFKDGTACLISTRFESIKPLISNEFITY